MHGIGGLVAGCLCVGLVASMQGRAMHVLMCSGSYQAVSGFLDL